MSYTVGEEYGGEFLVFVFCADHDRLVGESSASHRLPLDVRYVHTSVLPYVEHPYGKEFVEHIAVHNPFWDILNDQNIVQDTTNYRLLFSFLDMTPPVGISLTYQR